MAAGGTRAGSQTVAGYVAVRGEIDPAAALGAVVDGGGTIALPRVSREPPGLRFHRVVPGSPLARGRFDLYEPEATAEEIDLEALDVMIVPGLAFDAAGRRLGFGGGYYDQLLGGTNVGAKPAIRRPVLIGFAYDFQIVERCPAGVGDVPVDLVVTDARVLRRPAGEIA
jgi:5-formyltetrahydrofolate cyclo-ligase